MSINSIPTDPASLAPKEVCDALKTSAERGLVYEQVLARRALFGSNTLPTEPATPFWQLVLAQFEDVLVRILLLAATISFAMAVMERNASDFVEPFIILLILTLNAIVGVWQESRAEGAIEALKELVPSTTVVVRQGCAITVQSEELVPGDIVKLSVGSRVPADIRILRLDTTTLRIDESILTGESVEVIKHEEEQKNNRKRFAQNMVYSGTAVAYGHAVGVVVGTGSATEIGRIEKDVREQEAVRTPLQQKLDEFGVLLSKVIGYICLLVFAVNMVRWFYTHRHAGASRTAWQDRYVQPTVHCLKVAVALAVAAIPEGLPAVVTTCLALGTRRMARRNALVRDLPSVETLGRCSVICSDKTGTLTTNMMSVLEVFTMVDGSSGGSSVNTYTIEDSKFNVIPRAVSCDGRVTENSIAEDVALDMLATTAALCNEASLHSNVARGNEVEKVGEATEAALLVMAEKLAASPERMRPDAFRGEKKALWRKDATLEFTRDRKAMSVICSSAISSKVSTMFVKGAPEELLSRCSRVMLRTGKVVPMNARLASAATAAMDRMSDGDRALRCVGFAFRPCAAASTLNLSDPHKFVEHESDLTFLGVCGMVDPPRDGVREAIAKCHSARIRVVVITGDKKGTAEAICRQLGLLPSAGDSATLASLSFTGHEFEEMSLTRKREAARTAVLFSRVDPSHKMQLVQLLQEQGHICAMTGDGVNDSPALKRADIGIAMGSGTEVAKAASKMVLADDNFSTVVTAVGEGRTIFSNTKQFIRYLISSNIGEVVCVLATGLLGLPEALTPIQLLWVNLVTDGLPATALGFNAPDPDVMLHPPRRADEPIVGGWMFLRYMIVGTYIGLATVAGFIWWFLMNGVSFGSLTSSAALCANPANRSTVCLLLESPETARAIALSILVIIEMLNALNALSENQSLATARPSSNIWLLLSIASSVALHLMIMYVPFFANMFSITPLGVPTAVLASAKPWSVVLPTDFVEWKVVLVLSLPVIFIDEVTKMVARRFTK